MVPMTPSPHTPIFKLTFTSEPRDVLAVSKFVIVVLYPICFGIVRVRYRGYVSFADGTIFAHLATIILYQSVGLVNKFQLNDCHADNLGKKNR